MSCSERVRPDPRKMPKLKQEILAKGLYRELMRIRTEEPELWARLDKRAAEIRKERELQRQ